MNRTVGIVITIVTVLCCACPGFGMCVAGVMGLAGVPFTTTVGSETSTQPLAPGMAIGLMCLSVILIAIPIGMGIYTSRLKQAAAAVAQNFNGPIPPAS